MWRLTRRLGGGARIVAAPPRSDPLPGAPLSTRPGPKTREWRRLLLARLPPARDGPVEVRGERQMLFEDR